MKTDLVFDLRKSVTILDSDCEVRDLNCLKGARIVDVVDGGVEGVILTVEHKQPLKFKIVATHEI
jgi:hypothetical protein